MIGGAHGRGLEGLPRRGGTDVSTSTRGFSPLGPLLRSGPWMCASCSAAPGEERGRALAGRRDCTGFGSDGPAPSPPPALCSEADRAEAFRREGGWGRGPGPAGARPRSRLGWEAPGGAAGDVEPDGQLLQLVQAAAGARQVGRPRRTRALSGDRAAARRAVGRAPPPRAGGAWPRPRGCARARLDVSAEGSPEDAAVWSGCVEASPGVAQTSLPSRG